MDEKELEKVSGGVVDYASFDQLWEEYQNTHCGQCFSGPNGAGITLDGWTPEYCSKRKIKARASWAITGTVSCDNYRKLLSGGKA